MTLKFIDNAAKLCGTSLVMAAVLAGCGGGGGGSVVSTDSSAITIAGNAVKGTLKSAKISVYKTTAAGTQGDLLTETTSDGNGHYFATVTGYTGMVLLVASVVPGKTKMFDEATGVDIDPTSDFSMRTAVAAESGKSYSAQINPFTELAAVAALAKAGGLSASNVVQSNKDLSETLGFDPNSAAPDFDALTKAPRNALAAALTALSKMAKADDIPACVSAVGQAEKVKCVTNELASKGLADVGIKSALQAKLDVETDAAGLPVVAVTQPSGTPVTAASTLAQTKAFFAALRSNVKALDATDMSLQTELQAVTNDMQNRTTPVVTSSLDALEVAMRGAQLWKDILKNPNAAFVSNVTFYRYETQTWATTVPTGSGPSVGGTTIVPVPIGGCSFNSDTDYNILATSRADANYIACGTRGQNVSATNANGEQTNCQNVGEWCYSVWTTRVRLHPDAATPGKFTVYTQTRKAKMVLAAGNTTVEDKAARVQYGAAFPGNASVLTAAWDSTAQPTTVTLAGELSPGFQSNNNWMSYWDSASNRWIYKPATTSVLGDKHNVNLSASITKVGALDMLALSGSIDLIKSGVLETAIYLGAGSYMQATSGNSSAQDGSQEMLLKLKINTEGSAILGDLKLSAFKADKSGMDYIPTAMDFTGSIQRNGTNFFEGSVKALATNHAAFNMMLPPSSTNPRNMKVDLTGKIVIAQRPTLNLSLSVTDTDTGWLTSSTAFTGQYRQGLQTINLTGSSDRSRNQITMTNTDGVKMIVNSLNSVYPLTFGAADDVMGNFNSQTNRITYTDNTYEQF